MFDSIFQLMLKQSLHTFDMLKFNQLKLFRHYQLYKQTFGLHAVSTTTVVRAALQDSLTATVVVALGTTFWPHQASRTVYHFFYNRAFARLILGVVFRVDTSSDSLTYNEPTCTGTPHATDHGCLATCQCHILVRTGLTGDQF